MEPALTWLDLTAADRDKMRRVLDLFKEQGTVDEMGLGSLRDTLADTLFPGTSTIQTRLRYALFIPWIYQRLEAQQVSPDQIARQARAAEIALIEPLTQDDELGVIGELARASLSRLPSSVYWAGLVQWTIFSHEQSPSWYHRHFRALCQRRDGVGRADDPGVVWTKQPNWHPRLPKPPKEFPDEASFHLTREEAEFIQGRWEETCGGTLLAWFARHGSASPAARFWEEPTLEEASDTIRDTVGLAQRFSLHVEGAPLLYNLLLAERRNGPKDEELKDSYRSALEEWASREADAGAFDPHRMWMFVARQGGRLPSKQKDFVETWARRVAEIGPQAVVDDSLLRTSIERRELELKGGRARLRNKGRLLEWSGRVGVGRMDFRWFRVQQLLIDLHRGLAL